MSITKILRLAFRSHCRRRSGHRYESAAHFGFGVAIEKATDAYVPGRQILGGETISRGPQEELFSRNVGEHIQRNCSGKQPEIGIGRAAGGVQIVEGKDGVFCQIQSRIILKLDLCASCARYQAKASFQRKIGNCFLPDGARGLFIVLAAGNAHIAFHIADANNLGIGLVGIMMSKNKESFLL